MWGRGPVDIRQCNSEIIVGIPEPICMEDLKLFEFVSLVLNRPS